MQNKDHAYERCVHINLLLLKFLERRRVLGSLSLFPERDDSWQIPCHVFQRHMYDFQSLL